MKRLTTDNPNDNFMTMLNFLYGKDGWAHIRSDGENDDVPLTKWAKEQCLLRGWKYRVMSGLGSNTYKARYQRADKQGDVGWKGLAAVPWRQTREEAQADLDQLAMRKGWKEWNG